MTTAVRTTNRPAYLPPLPAGIFVLLGLIDIGLLGVVGSSIAPPPAVSVGVALLGLVTLVALVPARRGSRAALRTVVVTRVVSAVMAGAAFVAGAPVWVMVIEGFAIVATIVALVLLRRGPREA